MENLARWYAASMPRARVVSSTRTSGTLAGTSSWSVCTTRQAAPREAASARNAWPSRRLPRIAKKASPTPSARESIETPVMGTPRSPATRAPCVARTMSWTVNSGTVALGPLSRQDPPRDLTVVERQHVGAHDLIGLVTLSGDDDRVARLGPGEHGADRARTIGLGRDAARRGTGPAHADHDLVDDRLRPLRARVVGGHPHLVAEPRRDPAHDRALGAVPVAAA